MSPTSKTDGSSAPEVEQLSTRQLRALIRPVEPRDGFTWIEIFDLVVLACKGLDDCPLPGDELRVVVVAPQGPVVVTLRVKPVA